MTGVQTCALPISSFSCASVLSLYFTAAKYKDKTDAQEKLVYHVTSGEKVKFEDGHEEEHKKVKTSDPNETKNLVAWILTLQGGTKY